MNIVRNNPRFGQGLATTTTLWIIAGVVGTGVVFGAIALVTPGEETDPVALYTVEKGPLTISVAEAGTIQNREKRILKSEVYRRVSILWIVDEGTYVKEGDLLIELDASDLTERKLDRDIRVQNAQASLIRARENLEVVKSKSASDVEQAELDLEFAELDLRKYLEAEYLQSLKEADNAVENARGELQRAKDKADWSEKLFDKKYVTQNEMEADVAAARKKELQLEIEQMKRDVLVNYTHPRDKRQKESDVKQKQAALERTERRAKADVVQAEADLRAKQQEYDKQKNQLEEDIEQIAKCRIVAPVDGMVIYATSGKGSWRGNQEPLAEGQQVRNRQELIYLPTANEMMAQIKVHESVLKKVSTGMPVRVTTDALPGKTFRGEVSKIALLPDAQMIWLNPDLKVYSTEINLDNNENQLRAGMSCRAEIVISHYDDVLFVPVQSVLRVLGKPTVHVWNGKEGERRELELGLDNGRMVHVISGLEPGEQVMLAPPMTPSAVGPDEQALPDDLKQAAQEAAEKKQDDEKAKPKFSEADMKLIGTLQQMREHDVFSKLKLEPELLKKVNALLDAVDKGESVEIDPAIRSAMKKMMSRRGKRPAKQADNGNAE